MRWNPASTPIQVPFRSLDNIVVQLFNTNMKLSDFFSALSCEWRIRIVEIVSKGEVCQCELSDFLPLDKTTLSRHLSVLKRVGIITERREGKSKILSLSDPRVLKIFDLAREMLRGEESGG